jgi:hypothetical protein
VLQATDFFSIISESQPTAEENNVIKSAINICEILYPYQNMQERNAYKTHRGEGEKNEIKISSLVTGMYFYDFTKSAILQYNLIIFFNCISVNIFLKRYRSLYL